jgi:hypothetical protein
MRMPISFETDIIFVGELNGLRLKKLTFPYTQVANYGYDKSEVTKGQNPVCEKNACISAFDNRNALGYPATNDY